MLTIKEIKTLIEELEDLKKEPKNLSIIKELKIKELNIKNLIKKLKNRKIIEKSKNIDLKTLKQISLILGGSITTMDGLPEDLTTNDLIFYKYAQITSVDVERSFSVYKNFLGHNRRSFKLENIKNILLFSVIQINIIHDLITTVFDKFNFLC